MNSTSKTMNKATQDNDK